MKVSNGLQYADAVELNLGSWDPMEDDIVDHNKAPGFLLEATSVKK